MVVRGAPAIGVAAAFGIALAAQRGDDVDAAAAELARGAADGGQSDVGRRPDAARARRRSPI